MNNFYVYQLRRADEPHPFYIGKGTLERCQDHFKEAARWDGVRCKGINAYKLRKILKAGKEGVQVLVEFVVKDVDEDYAHRVEVWSIHLWGRHDKKCGPLTNKTDGGEGVSGWIATEEYRLRASEQMKGDKRNLGRIASPEARNKMSERMKGNQFTTGREIPEEEKQMRREARLAMFEGNPDALQRQRDIVARINAKPKQECPHCGKHADSGNYKQFHGDNCKQSPNFDPERRKRKTK